MEFVHFQEVGDDDEDVEVDEDGLGEGHEDDEEGDRDPVSTVSRFVGAVAEFRSEFVNGFHLNAPSGGCDGLN